MPSSTKFKRIRTGSLPTGLVFFLIVVSGYAKRTNVATAPPVMPDRLIVPGLRIGTLELGEKREEVLKAFPFKPAVDQEYPSCGITYAWSDSTQGNVFIEFRKGLVNQIGSATPRYRTREGLTSYSSPAEVRRHERNLEAYVLPIPSSVALGGRPLVFWVGRSRGIAFAFAYDTEHSKRYLYEIIIFTPNKGFCVEGVMLDGPRVHRLPPYSLELSDNTEN